MSQGRAAPRLTVGLPVHNGERFLAQAISSILAQDFRDFELIVSDNASDDGTQAICDRFVQQDSRVRYVRQPTNLGASPNWNFVVAEARGELFSWAACDDAYAATHLSTCIALLDADPEVVLAYTGTVDIDAEGRLLKEWDEHLRTDVADPADRFRDLISRDHMCFQLFGVVRTEVLRRTRMLGPYPDADRVTLAELALHGRFRAARQPLFLHREHEGRSVNVHPASRDRLVWFDSSNTHSRAFPAWRLGREFFLAALRAPLGPQERVRVLLSMQAWLRHSRTRLVRNVGRVLLDEARARTGEGRRP